MIRDISSDIIVNLKDRLRDVRHLIRASRVDTKPQGQDLPDILFGQAARVVDKAFTAAESISISLVSQDPSAHSATIEARSLGAYFPANLAKGAALFRRDAYYLTKRLFSVLGSDNALIHEATFSAVHATMSRRHAHLLFAARDGGLAQIGAACATMTVELRAQYDATPITFPAHVAAKPDRRTQYLCFAAIALAIGLATYSEVEPCDEKLVESTLLALQARQEKFGDAIESASPEAALSSLYAFLIPHLP